MQTVLTGSSIEQNVSNTEEEKTLFSEMLVQCACAALEGRGVTWREGDV